MRFLKLWLALNIGCGLAAAAPIPPKNSAKAKPAAGKLPAKPASKAAQRAKKGRKLTLAQDLRKQAETEILGLSSASFSVSATTAALMRSLSASTETVAVSGLKSPEFIWTLEDARRIAFEQNPNLKSALANFEAAKKVVGEAASGYLPHVDVLGNYYTDSYLNGNKGNTGYPPPTLSILPTPFRENGVVTTINQTLFDFGKTLENIRQTLSGKAAAKARTEAVKNAIDLSVQQAFYSVLGNVKLVRVARQGVDKFREIRRITALMVRVGTRPSFDLTQAEVQLAQAELKLITAQNTLDLSKILLLNLMGFMRQPVFLLNSKNAEPQSYPAHTFDLGTLVKTAYVWRPEVERGRRDLDAAKFALKGEYVKGYLPTLSFMGMNRTQSPTGPYFNSGVNGSPGGGYGIAGNYNQFKNPESVWVGGFEATWNILDGGMTYFRTGELKFRLQETQAALEKEMELVNAEVATAYYNLIRTENHLRVTAGALAFAQINSRLARERYQVGVATILELLVAQMGLVEAEGAYVESRYGHDAALSALAIKVNRPLPVLAAQGPGRQ